MVAKNNDPHILVTLLETRQFSPSAEFLKSARFSPSEIEQLRAASNSDSDRYWEEAGLTLQWDRPFHRLKEWDPPFAKWYLGGKLNASVNCVDRHLVSGPHYRGNQRAILWEGEDGQVTEWTYSELHHQVVRAAAVLRSMGLRSGDRAAIYLPMIPEAVVAMLACARVGVTHTVVFGGFSSEALKDRVQDASAKLIITANYGLRKGSPVNLLEQVEKAASQCPTVEKIWLVERERAGTCRGAIISEKKIATVVGEKKIKWHESLAAVSESEAKRLGVPESVDSEHPLFILYTSGTTGKPKGIVHSTAGYLAGAKRSTELVFDLKPEDLYWCTADIGWITGHSYVVYGPLATGASIFIYEGAPTTPSVDRFWSMIARHKVSVFYTAPTAIRAFMKFGEEHPGNHDLSSLRLLGTVGEPINPEAWMWYHRNIGKEKCPIVDTFWQTETGSIVISPLPQDTKTKPGSATLPLPGYDVDVVDKQGKSVPLGSGGLLIIRKPWPSMARTIFNDPERFKKQYFSDFAEGIYFTGDGARRDQDGYIWCLGRVDDVLNVSGHRLGTMEIESALVSHHKVAEAAVVGRPDDLKGQAVVAFVTLKKTAAGISKDLNPIKEELKSHVVKEIGALARPEEIRFTEGLPKTRSGKIMRRLLRELATNGQVKGDTTTLEDLSVIAALQQDEE